MVNTPFEVGSRSRCAREGGWLGRKRIYRCRKCDSRFQVDTLNPLPEEDRICPSCKSEALPILTAMSNTTWRQ